MPELSIASFLLLGLGIFTAYMVEVVTGFGSTVLLLPFITLILGIKMTVVLLCVMSVFMAAYIIARSWRQIQWEEFLFIAVCAGCGMPIGIYMFDNLNPVALCLILGAFMVGVGINGVRSTLKAGKDAVIVAPRKKSWLMRFVVFCGGVIHGAFGSGGPFIVIYAARALPDKALFRVTLSLLWFFLGTWRVTVWIAKGEYIDAQFGILLLKLVPFVVAGLLLGDYLHRRVSEYLFRVIVYSVLVAAGLVMFVNNLIKLF